MKETVSYFVIIDAIGYLFYSLLLTYFIHDINVKLFFSFKNNIKDATKELSKGMDQISENLCMLQISNEKKHIKLTPFTISSKFLSNFNNTTETTTTTNININNIENDLNIEELFKNFLFISNDNIGALKIEEVEALAKAAYKQKNTLFHDIVEFAHSKTRRDNSAYKSATYVVKFPNQENLNYFEVKYTKYDQPYYLSNRFIIVLFKDIGSEKYNMKSQQMNTFSNILVSTLSHELNNPLNGLNGEIFAIKAELNEITNNIEEISRLEYNQDLKVKDLKTRIHQIYTYLKCIKYLKEKINLIAKNFAIYSKFKLKLFFNIKYKDISLKVLLQKTIKLFKTLALINDIDLNLDLSIADHYFIKTDIEVTNIIISNIVLMTEKHSKRAQVQIFVTDELDIPILQPRKISRIKIIFKLENIIKYENSKVDIAGLESLDMINIFSNNNKNLAENIDYLYKETFTNNDLKIELQLKGVYTFSA